LPQSSQRQPHRHRRAQQDVGHDFERLKVDVRLVKPVEEGLSEAEAQRRLVEFGANEVEEVAHEALLVTFAKEFAHFFAIILWIAAALAFFAEWREPGQGMATLGFAIFGVILINGVFSFWQAYRAEQVLAVLKKLLPDATNVVRSGTVWQVPATMLVPGDVILLEAGDILAADCRLLEAFSVRVNNATVTASRGRHRATPSHATSAI